MGIKIAPNRMLMNICFLESKLFHSPLGTSQHLRYGHAILSFDFDIFQD